MTQIKEPICRVCQQPTEYCLCEQTPQPSLRGIEGALIPLRISIASIPHSSQRYDTCGDYYYGQDHIQEDTLFINVSQLASRREMILVAIHELIEWALCEAAGIGNEEIDEFDKNFNHTSPRPGGRSRTMITDMEPGDSQDAPYYKQHQFATGIERILAAEMEIDWLEYERHIEDLSNEA
jgi:hypothetical protein